MTRDIPDWVKCRAKDIQRQFEKSMADMAELKQIEIDMFVACLAGMYKDGLISEIDIRRRVGFKAAETVLKAARGEQDTNALVTSGKSA